MVEVGLEKAGHYSTIMAPSWPPPGRFCSTANDPVSLNVALSGRGSCGHLPFRLLREKGERTPCFPTCAGSYGPSPHIADIWARPSTDSRDGQGRRICSSDHCNPPRLCTAASHAPSRGSGNTGAGARPGSRPTPRPIPPITSRTPPLSWRRRGGIEPRQSSGRKGMRGSH